MPLWLPRVCAAVRAGMEREWLIDAAALQKVRSGEALVSSTEVASDVEF